MLYVSSIESIVTSDRGADEDVKRRIGKARQAFNMLRPVWNSSLIPINIKLRIFCNRYENSSSIQF